MVYTRLATTKDIAAVTLKSVGKELVVANDELAFAMNALIGDRSEFPRVRFPRLGCGVSRFYTP